ncbi:MAG TPA: hypothetical protein VG672_02685 [Bryobacteraceae bacterium]|nr:hypothetical protein [Bryobacteraceae bacterium]
MAGLLAVLKALERAVRRDLGSFGQIKTNNLFLFIALLAWAAIVSGMEPQSAEPLMLLLGLLLLFPLSADPLGKIPPSRLALWPLSRAAKLGLRLSSILLSPVVWFALFLILKTKRLRLGVLFLLGAAGMQMAIFLARFAIRRAPALELPRYVPGLPGRLRELTRKNARQMFTVLDTYAALALSAGGAAYRFLSRHPDPAADPILALLVSLALSSYAQCLFGLDARGGMTRYRLLPLRGWQILWAKDAPYLCVTLILTAPLSLGPGLAFGLVALAVGHHSSVMLAGPQQRWRFTGSRLLPGVVQAFAALAVGFTESQQGWPWLVLAAALYGASLWVYGRLWERSRDGGDQ